MPQPRKPRQPAKRAAKRAAQPTPPRRPVRPLDTEDVVLTPGGARPRSLVHELEPGHHISLKDGHVRIIETATGKVVKDLGEYATHEGGESEPEPSPGKQGPTPSLPDIGWIESSHWQNTGTDPIISFTTTWIVPPAPSSDDTQTVFLFNGMQPDNAAHILQPVLQWGGSHAGGGKYWAIANWYADGQGGPAVNSSVQQVQPGTVLTGVMTCTQQTKTGFDYTCTFAGYPSLDVTVTDVPQLTWAYETLECYGKNPKTPLTQCSDYPATPLTAMYDIEIKTGTPGQAGTDAAPDWQANTSYTDCGQSCQVVSNDSPGGAVYLYYRDPGQAFYFINDKSSFGRDEVADQIATAGGVFPAAFYLALDGFTVQQLTIDQPQLAAPAVSGAFNDLIGVSVYPSTTYSPSYDSTNLYTPQRILYPFDVKFTPLLSLINFPIIGVTPQELDATITIGAAGSPNEQTLTTSTVIELAAGADPYFANVDPKQDNVTYRSQDLRVFTITPTASGSAPVDGVSWNFQGGSPSSFDSAAAYQYIRDVLTHFNGTYTDPNGVDPFDVNNPKLPSQGAVYSGDSTVTQASLDLSLFPPIALNYNFAIARVRLQSASGTAGGQAQNVKVFFRLFTTQTFDTDYINTSSAVSAGDPNITYPSLPPGSPDQPTSPLPGTDASGTINGCSLPYFAAADQSDLSPGGVNNQTIVIPAGRDKTWAYFGCFLNVYDSSDLIGGYDSQHWLVGASHSCLVAQIAYDGLPIENSNGVIENPGNCTQLAQRNLQVSLSGNPGFPATHLIPQTFDTRPSPPATGVPLGDYPDELMIDWRNTPPGTTATIYWPAVNPADVLALTARLYPSSTLAAVDAHTLKCEVTPGMTYIPVPTGAGESFAGLITLQLPSGIHLGNEFDVVIRRITSRRYDERAIERIGATARAESVREPRAINWRYIVGAFQMTIPVAPDSVILPGEENLLAVLKWRFGRLAPSNRWYPVLKAYIRVVERRVRGLGGDPAKVEPNPLGNLPPVEKVPRRKRADLAEFTGKVIGISYDRFGDFKGFELLTLRGHEVDFHGRERRLEHLVREAWLERHLITVLAAKHDPDWPAEIILRRG